MIRNLVIQNFALIDQIDIQFSGVFTVITGETGSGKSILLNALNLILGGRANFSVIGTLNDKSVVEAELDISGFDMRLFFERNELDYFDTTIVRREIYKQGRSRAFINDTPVQLNTLKEFTSGLIHIHSQYNTLELKDRDFQLKVLDVLSNSLQLQEEFEVNYMGFERKQKLLNEQIKHLSDSASKIDYDAFQLSELHALNLDNTDYESMQRDLHKFENADELIAAFGSLVNLLETEGGVLEQLRLVGQTLQKNSTLDPVLDELNKRISSVLIELKDISSEAEEQSGKITIDPQKLIVLTSKLDAYNKAIFKHGVHTQEDLVDLMEDLSSNTDGIARLEESISKLKSELNIEEVNLFKMAERLHDLRKKNIPKIESEIIKALDGLKLENTVLDFRLTKLTKLKRSGVSSLEIFFSPNSGVAAVPVHQAASGGELSRVMLALQSLMSQNVQLQTILFDEIDTGVSGDVAQKIGTTLKEMGKEMQVIAITHLPQVAALGLQHLSVEKSVVNGRTQSSVVELDMTARLEEVARLMSGDTINDAALANAKALMMG